MKLTILSPERRLLTGVEVSSVTLTGSEGQIQVFPGHKAMIGTLETGIFGYEAAQGPGVGVISSGFFEVKDDNIVVMGETIELKAEIDSARARAAQMKAEAVLR